MSKQAMEEGSNEAAPTTTPQRARRLSTGAVPIGFAVLLGAGLAAVPGTNALASPSGRVEPSGAIVSAGPDQSFLAMDQWGPWRGAAGGIDVRGTEQIRPPTAASGTTPVDTTPSPTTSTETTVVNRAPSIPPTTAPPATAPPTTAPPTPSPPTSAAPATAAPPANVPNAATPQERGALALSRIHYPWTTALPGWTITFQAGRSGVFGFTYVQERRIEIFVREDQSDALLAHVIAHELGHAVDVSHNNEADRQRWQQTRGIEDVPWWPGDGLTDFSTGAGDFAEAFAVWQVGPGSYRSRVAGVPTTEQLDVLADLSG